MNVITVLWFFSRFVLYDIRYGFRRHVKYAKLGVFVLPERCKYALFVTFRGIGGEAPGFSGIFGGKCVKMHGFVSSPFLKYWFYMVRFDLETIIKTKREKNHSMYVYFFLPGR